MLNQDIENENTRELRKLLNSKRVDPETAISENVSHQSIVKPIANDLEEECWLDLNKDDVPLKETYTKKSYFTPK